MIREAKTENGWVRGIEAADPRITVFKGIPFAAPPIRENRWRAPQPAADWEGIRDASRFAPISMQSIPGLGTDVYCKEWHVDPEIPMDEDCLYLNVWTSAKTVDENHRCLSSIIVLLSLKRCSDRIVLVINKSRTFITVIIRKCSIPFCCRKQRILNITFSF